MFSKKATILFMLFAGLFFVALGYGLIFYSSPKPGWERATVLMGWWRISIGALAIAFAIWIGIRREKVITDVKRSLRLVR